MSAFVNTEISIMDHLAAQCKKKLETFRIKELKDVLARIGAGKQGKKQVLVAKIMALLLSAERGSSTGLKTENLTTRNLRSREDVARIVDDVYRMRRVGATELASVGDIGTTDGLFSFTQQQSLPDGVYCATDSKTRCPCGNTMEFDSMIQCDTPSCLAWRHARCVIVSEKKVTEPEISTIFFCEVCRIEHGDPFCVSVSHPLPPIKTIASTVYSPEGGVSTMQNREASFSLTHNDREYLLHPDYDLQIWCVLLGDEVAFRMHWPLKADLRVNGDSVRVTNRPGQQKLGVNGRDDGPVITNHIVEGLNRIVLAAYDERSFCLGVRIVRRLTVDQVVNQIPSEAEGERLEEALARVRRFIGGGRTVGDDSDSDLEVVSEWVTVSLRCPMSGSRIMVAGRFKPCMHMGCFDLHTFVQLNQRARKWQCPSCLKNYSLKDLVIDPFFTQVARALESYDEDVSEVEMKPDGFWRPKLDGDAKFNEPWQSPVALITTAKDSSHLAPNSVKVKVEETLPKIGFVDAFWNFNGTLGLADLTRNDMMSEHYNEVLTNGARSRNSTASQLTREVSSVNQTPMKFYKPFPREEVEVSSCPIYTPVDAYFNGFLGGFPEDRVTAEVIVLSDEEDNSTDFNAGVEDPGTFHTNHAKVHENVKGCFLDSQRDFLRNSPEALAEVGSFQPNVTVAVDFLGVSQEASMVPAQKEAWQIENQVRSCDFLSYGPESSMGQSSQFLDCYTPMQDDNPSTYQNQLPRGGINMIDTTGMHPLEETPITFVPTYQTLCNERSKELPALDPSLREFLPQQPARSAANLAAHEPREALAHDMQDGWFSLSLGGCESFNSEAPLSESSAQRTQINSLLEPASLLLDLRHQRTHVDGSCSTITPPDQYQRNYFCIDFDSD